MLSCRACFSTLTPAALSLGSLPLANALQDEPHANVETYLLTVHRCIVCGLVQLAHSAPPSEMFSKYLYSTGASRTMIEHFDKYAESLVKSLSSSQDKIVDIGSNDGTLLKAFHKYGMRNLIGVEPATNLAQATQNKDVKVISRFFDGDSVELIGRESAKIATANNVVSHVPDLDGFVSNVAKLLAPDGTFVFEMPWVMDWLKRGSFDIIYHEHLSYFGFRPLSITLARHGLIMTSLTYFSDIHGGSWRGTAVKVGHEPGLLSGSYNKLEEIFDIELRELSRQALADFEERMHKTRDRFRGMLTELKSQGKKIVGYGAPAKATILLNYCRIDNSIIDFLSDSTPIKQGKYVPGVDIPIVSPERFQDAQPDYAVMFAWNYEKEIVEKEQAWIRKGGKFIVPFPEPHIVS